MTSEPYIPTAPPLAQLGRFELLRRIGTGGMADVYVGRDSNGRLSAIKVLHPELAREVAISSRFVNEARVMAAIHHPNVVAVHEAGEVDGRAYYTMEYLEGDTLSKVVRRGRLPAPRVLAVSRQIAAALAAAHAVSVVHRDLKPSNVMLVGGDADWVRVLDFGIAKVLDGGPDGADLTRTGALLGTPRYMSPEQCKSASDIDHRSDIYSLGCVMYFMATGRPPFEADSIGELLGMQLYIEPEPPSARAADLPAALSELILWCLRKSAGERPGSMTEVMEALDRVAVAPDDIAALAPAVRAERTALRAGFGAAVPDSIDPPAEVAPAPVSRVRRAAVIAGAAIGAVAIAAIVSAAIPDHRAPAAAEPPAAVHSRATEMSARPAEPTSAVAPAPSPPSAPAAAPTVQFTFTSDPPGASVTLEPDRTSLGTTPVVLILPSRPDQLVFSFEKDGHLPVKLALPGDRGIEQSIPLPRAERSSRRRPGTSRPAPAEPPPAPPSPPPRVDTESGTLDPFDKYPRTGPP